MHTLSAAVIKGKAGPTNLKPREGTKIRTLYDLFYANKGKAVSYNYEKGKSVLPQLIDIYGLDIRYVGRGRSKQYMLVGEWFGITYVDYLAEELKHESRGSFSPTVRRR